MPCWARSGAHGTADPDVEAHALLGEVQYSNRVHSGLRRAALPAAVVSAPAHVTIASRTCDQCRHGRSEADVCCADDRSRTRSSRHVAGMLGATDPCGCAGTGGDVITAPSWGRKSGAFVHGGGVGAGRAVGVNAGQMVSGWGKGPRCGIGVRVLERCAGRR